MRRVVGSARAVAARVMVARKEVEKNIFDGLDLVADAEVMLW